MKKLLLICGLIVLIAAIGGLWYFNRGDESVGSNVQEESESEAEVIIDPIEIKIISSNGDKIYNIEEDEKDLFQDKQYVSLEYLKDLYRFKATYESETNTLSMVYEETTFSIDFSKKNYRINYGEVNDNNLVHQIGDVIYLDINEFQKIYDVEFYVVDEPFTIIEIDFSRSGQRSQLIDNIVGKLPEKINLTWEAVYNVQPKIENMYDMPGLDIISPVWFELETSQGDFGYKLNEDYINWARSEGYVLWPAITNSFKLDLTRDMVSSSVNRELYISKLLKVYTRYDFHGINIDFENMYKEDRDLLNQFIAELTAAFHREKILVSMDVTFPGGSDTWSKCYDHEVLGQWLDFMIIMAYDQHWASSPISGTVAGLQWLNSSIPKITSIVDSDKVVLAMPFYMRVWYERPSVDTVNEMKVTSESITMFAMENILEQRELNILWDNKTGQNYVSYINSKYNAVNKIWIEDATSLALKVELVHDYDLKGVASWRRGYELQSIWPVIDKALRKR